MSNGGYAGSINWIDMVSYSLIYFIKLSHKVNTVLREQGLDTVLLLCRQILAKMAHFKVQPWLMATRGHP